MGVNYWISEKENRIPYSTTEMDPRIFKPHKIMWLCKYIGSINSINKNENPVLMKDIVSINLNKEKSFILYYGFF